MTADRPQAVSRSSISEQAEDHIRTMVLDGTLKAGERLNEVSIAESIGISRGPLREAIKRLSGQGYLTMETHRGAFVKQYQPREIIELYELRSALELFSVRLATRRAREEQVDELRVDLEAESRRAQASASVVADGSLAHATGPYVAELDFHQRLSELGGNRLIQSQLLEANHKLYLALSPTHRSDIRKRHAVASHLEILAALRARDEDRCVDLLKDHLNDSMHNSLQVMGLEDIYDVNEGSSE